MTRRTLAQPPPAPPLQAVTPFSARFVLPIPPSANHLWRNVQGRTVLSVKAREYRDTVERIIWLWKAQQTPADRTRLPLTIRLAVSLVVIPATRRHQDLDNLFKATLDALTHAGLWKDDAQIDEIHAFRAPIKDPCNPRVLLTVSDCYPPVEHDWGSP